MLQSPVATSRLQPQPQAMVNQLQSELTRTQSLLQREKLHGTAMVLQEKLKVAAKDAELREVESCCQGC